MIELNNEFNSKYEFNIRLKSKMNTDENENKEYNLDRQIIKFNKFLLS